MIFSMVGRSLPELREQAEEIGFPCVVKPVDSLTCFRGQKAVVLKDGDELSLKFGSSPAGASFSSCRNSRAGTATTAISSRKRGNSLLISNSVCSALTGPDYTGYGVDGDAVPPTTVLKDYTAMLIAELRYLGVGCGAISSE